MSFGDRLEEALRLARKERKELAAAVGISVQAIGQVIKGQTKALDAINCAKAARFLAVDFYWLATGDGSPEARSAPSDLTQREAELLQAFRNLPEDEQVGLVIQTIKRGDYFQQMVEKQVQKVLQARGVRNFTPPTDAKVERHLGLPTDRRHREDRRREQVPVAVDRRQADRRAYQSPTAEYYSLDPLPDQHSERRKGSK